MQTLYPLLSNAKDDGASGEDVDDDVLSPELRDHFDAMRAMARAESRPSDEDASEEPRQRKVRQEEQKSAKKQMALKTALAVESEMSRLRNGIAELEARLAQQEAAGADLPPAAVAFPSLPAVVPDDSQDNHIVEDEQEEELEAMVKTAGKKTDKEALVHTN